jgi:hypothetical protein
MVPFVILYPVTAFCEQYLPKLQCVTIEGRVEGRRREMMKKRANKNKAKGIREKEGKQV